MTDTLREKDYSTSLIDGHAMQTQELDKFDKGNYIFTDATFENEKITTENRSLLTRLANGDTTRKKLLIGGERRVKAEDRIPSKGSNRMLWLRLTPNVVRLIEKGRKHLA